MKRVIATWLPIVIWAGGIFYLSSVPSLSSGLGTWDFYLRKIAHMTEFGVLAWLLLRAFNQNLTGLQSLGLSAMISLLYAVSDEWHQSFVPGREATIRDVIIDGIGILVALILIAKKKNQQLPHSAGSSSA